jgi:hypothetical protein
LRECTFEVFTVVHLPFRDVLRAAQSDEEEGQKAADRQGDTAEELKGVLNGYLNREVGRKIKGELRSKEEGKIRDESERHS